MSNFSILFKQEIGNLMRRPSSYFIAALFLTLMGFNFVYILFLNMQATDQPIDCLKSFFELFWLPTLFIIPLITMRTLSEEQRSGLLESLLTTPLSPVALVFSKFLATYLFYVFLWCLCLLFPYFTQYFLGNDLTTPLIQPTVLYGGCLFLLSSSFFFVAIGILASSLTKTQSFAGFLCFCFLFIVLVGVKMIGEMHHFSYTCSLYVDFFETLDHLLSGVFDVRPFVFHFGSGILLLLLTTTVLENKLLK